MKRIVVCVLVMLLSLGAWARGEKQTIVFDVNLHCQGCITKIEKNIAFEKGVKDLVCDLEKKTVTVVFDPTKTSVEQLQAAFEKIGKPAKPHEEADEAQQSDAQTGATTLQ